MSCFYSSLGRLSKEKKLSLQGVQEILRDEANKDHIFERQTLTNYYAASREGIYADVLHAKGEILAEKLADDLTVEHVGVSFRNITGLF